MRCWKKCCVFILAAVILSCVLRVPRLQQRPMHTDEAIHAIKFGTLLEEGVYRYDREEYHGPTLNYLTLIIARLSSAKELASIDEFTLRIGVVFFGVLIIILGLLLLDGIGAGGVILACVLTALSPAMVYFSRYYIQEMLLVCFTFGAIVSGYRYSRGKNILWALLTGAFLGLMHATKETCIIAFGSMLLALLLMLIMQRKEKGSISDVIKGVKFLHIGVGCLAAVIISALLYSSFFSNPSGILDSLRTYSAYFDRAGGNSLHIYPWYYYLKMLIYFRLGQGPIWSEGIILILATVGIFAVVTKKTAQSLNLSLLRFLAFYTIIMTVIYSVIPYKTPWCMLGFLHGMILLGAVGGAWLVKSAGNIRSKVFVCILLTTGAGHLCWQGYLATYKYYADPVNPYVYGHTSDDIFSITNRIEEIAEVHPDGRGMSVQVICPGDDYWPLPWYLRSFTNVGFWNSVEGDWTPAPVIIASSSVQSELVDKLYQKFEPGKAKLYVPLFDSYTELRPQVEMVGLITKELWDTYQNQEP